MKWDLLDRITGSRMARRLIVIIGALVITLVVFGFFGYLVSLLPQPQPQPTIVTVDIYRSTPQPKP